MRHCLGPVVIGSAVICVTQIYRAKSHCFDIKCIAIFKRLHVKMLTIYIFYAILPVKNESVTSIALRSYENILDDFTFTARKSHALWMHHLKIYLRLEDHYDDFF